jgi:hypothetical protein
MEWPKGGKPVSFEDLTRPIARAIRFAYEMKRRRADKDIPWDGLQIGGRERACSLPVEQALSAENLAYSLEDQGRDALAEILGIQAQLAFEQGRRIALGDIEIWLTLIEVECKSDKYTKPIREYFHK